MSSSDRSAYALVASLLFVMALFATTFASASDEPIRLTKDGTLKRDPVFISQGKKLVYIVQDSRVLMRAMVLDVETGNVAPLHPESQHNQFAIAFSPDERYLAFPENTGNLTLKFVIRDTQTKKDVEIKCKGRGGTRSPTFSPDGKRVLYCFAESGPQHIFSVDLNGKDKKQLTEGVGINNWPSYTPDGRTIVFGSSRDGNYELYAMDADGKNVRRLTNERTMDIRPRVSPDGERVVFVSSRDGNREVYVMNVDGTGVVRITHSEERDDYPTWHPDSKHVVCMSERRGRFDLYKYSVPETRK